MISFQRFDLEEKITEESEKIFQRGIENPVKLWMHGRSR